MPHFLRFEVIFWGSGEKEGQSPFSKFSLSVPWRSAPAHIQGSFEHGDKMIASQRSSTVSVVT